MSDDNANVAVNNSAAQDTNKVSIVAKGNDYIATADNNTPAGNDGFRVDSSMEFDDAGKPIVGGIGEPQQPQQQQQEPSPEPSTEDILAKHAQAESDASGLLTEKGLDFAALRNEWTKNGGSLSEKSVAALEAAGFSREMQETFIAGQQAKAAQVDASLHALVGGAENYNKAFEWAAKNLDNDSIAYIRKAYQSNDIATVRMIVKGVYAQMQASESKAKESLKQAPVMPEGNPYGNYNSGIRPFANREEEQEAFNNPKYRTSAAYRKEVEARVRARLSQGK